MGSNVSIITTLTVNQDPERLRFQIPESFHLDFITADEITYLKRQIKPTPLQQKVNGGLRVE